MAGAGGDTIVNTGEFESGVAAGGDTERPNYFPWEAEEELEFWEGGGTGSVASPGMVVFHYELPGTGSLPGEETEKEIRPSPNLPQPTSDRRAAVLSCKVPRLRGLRPPAARRALVQAHCQLKRVTHRHAARRMHGRVVSQRPAPGTSQIAGTRVTVVVGAP